MRATLRATEAPRYRRPGGPWDGATLDDLSRAGGGTGGTGRAGGGTGLRVVDGERRLDADDLDRAVAGVAGALRARGVRRRAAVVWQLPNCAESIVLFRACWRLGAVAVPLHHQLGAPDVARLVDRVAPVVTFAGEGMSLGEVGPADPVRGPSSWFARAAFSGGTGDRPVVAGAASPADIAVVLFTSGSTGEPKGVLHTHRALASKMRAMVPIHGLGPSDAVLMPLPMAHISGLLNGVLVPTAAVMTSVLMERWDPERALACIEDERVTFMGGPPTLFTDMLAAEGYDPGRISSLRVISTGGMGVSAEFVVAAAEGFGAQVKRTYGSTEIPTITTCGPLDGGEMSAARGRDTDGRTFGDSEIRIVDAGSGRPVPAGEVGEVWCRGPEMFAGYLEAADNRGVVRGGWFRTGDLGVVDDAGWLRIVGRLKDVIIRAGENISSVEVERVLEAHPEVRHAVVVGRPDPRVGERVAAFVVGDPGFDLHACRQWFLECGVARFKVPESVTRVDEIPRLPAGKPDRARLRALASAATGPERDGETEVPAWTSR